MSGHPHHSVPYQSYLENNSRSSRLMKYLRLLPMGNFDSERQAGRQCCPMELVISFHGLTTMDLSTMFRFPSEPRRIHGECSPELANSCVP